MVESSSHNATLELGNPSGNTMNSASLSRGTLRLTLVVALLAEVFGRAMAQALPGSRSGLGKLLDANRWAAGFFTQLLAALVVVAAGRFTWLTWLDQRTPHRYRFLATPAATLVIFLVIAACFDILISPYTPEISLVLGMAGTTVALYAAAMCLGPPPIRAAGIVLALVAAASIAQVSARLLALLAGDAALHAQYVLSRWLASAAAVLDVASLVAVVIWITKRDRRGRLVVLVNFGIAIALGLAAQRGTSTRAGFFEVLLSRLLAQLHREPSAFFPRVIQDTQEVFAFIMAAWLLWRPRSELPELRSCLAIVLLARSSPDIPLCAGLLVTGALGLSLMAAEWRHPSGEPVSSVTV